MTLTIDGSLARNWIAGDASGEPGSGARATDPATGEEVGPSYPEATEQEIDRACSEAAVAFQELRTWTATRRAELLRTTADELDALGDELLEVARSETGLPLSRLQGERGRTTGQLRAFADHIEEGSYQRAIIQQVTNGPDIRRVQVPIGPVAVFGASNFPLAFSVPGGDTAAALAAGCPVVFKAHPSHPGTSVLAARAINAAVAAAGAPRGTFSLLHGAGHAVGTALVEHPAIEAVAFTGSEAGGRALFDIAARRPKPIPVYAEMGSLNPILVTAAAAAHRTDEIAAGFAGSVSMGVGQFCTKPGLLYLPAGEAGDGLVTAIEEQLTSAEAAPMLNAGVCTAFSERTHGWSQVEGVRTVVAGDVTDGEGFAARPWVMETDVATFETRPELREENFGPISLIVRYAEGELDRLLGLVPGSLTASIHHEPDEAGDLAGLVARFEQVAGRIVFNDFPTGVAVNAAMHHGGPYPATTAPAHTSVGATAIDRFLRPVAFQDAPAELLPAALQNHNPLGILRFVNGVWSDGPLGEQSR